MPPRQSRITVTGAQDRLLKCGCEQGVERGGLSAGAGQGLPSPRSPGARPERLSCSVSSAEAGGVCATLLLTAQSLLLALAWLPEPSAASVCSGRGALGTEAPSSCSGTRGAAGAASAAGGASAAATTDVEVTSMVMEPTAVSGCSLLTLMRATKPEAAS